MRLQCVQAHCPLITATRIISRITNRLFLSLFVCLFVVFFFSVIELSFVINKENPT